MPATLNRNKVTATHNTTPSPYTTTCTTHPVLLVPQASMPKTTLLCTQVTNTMHSRQNGTRCRDGVKVLWCCSYLVWLVFEGSIPTCACFHWENFFVTCTYKQSLVCKNESCSKALRGNHMLYHAYCKCAYQNKIITCSANLVINLIKVLCCVCSPSRVTGRKRASQGPILPSDEPVVSKRLRTADPRKEVQQLSQSLPHTTHLNPVPLKI